MEAHPENIDSAGADAMEHGGNRLPTTLVKCGPKGLKDRGQKALKLDTELLIS